MAVKLEINANVVGAAQIDKLNKSLEQVGTSASIADRALKGFNNIAEKGKKQFEDLGSAIKIALAGGIAFAAYEAQKFVKDTIKVGIATENLQTRLTLAFGSIADGGEAFRVINEYVSKTPFSLSQVSNALNDLKEVSSTPQELANNLQIVGRIASTFAIPFEEAAQGFQKSLQDGIESSRTFKNLGIANIIGYQEGVTYSIDEISALFQGTFGNGGKLANATSAFNNTLGGQISQLNKQFDSFQQAAGKIVVGGLTTQLQRLQKELGGSGASLDDLGTIVGDKIVTAFIKLEGYIKTFIENFDKIVGVIQVIITYEIAAYFAAMGAAILQVTGALKLLTIAWNTSPLGLVVTVVTTAAAAFLIWRDKVDALTESLSKGLTYLKEWFNSISKNLTGTTIFDDVDQKSNQNKLSIEEEIEQIKRLNIEANKIKQINVTTGIPTDTVIVAQDNADEYVKAWEEQYAKEIEKLTSVSGPNLEAPAGFEDNLSTMVNEAYKLREVFDSLNLDSKQIGSTISDTWLSSMRAGDGLMKSILNSAKALLNTIIEQIIRQTIQIGVEKVFDELSNKRKAVNGEIADGISKQTDLSTKLSQVWDSLTGIISKVGDSVSGLGSTISSVIGNLGDSISNVFSNISSGSGNLFDSIGNIFSGSGGGGGFDLSSVTDFFSFAEGGVVPGGAPYTDRVPALLTPGETVIPRGESVGGGQSYTTYITQNLNTNDLNTALISAIRTNAETVNSILQSERNK
jgi:hypothetical protein